MPALIRPDFEQSGFGHPIEPDPVKALNRLIQLSRHGGHQADRVILIIHEGKDTAFNLGVRLHGDPILKRVNRLSLRGNADFKNNETRRIRKRLIRKPRCLKEFKLHGQEK